MLPETHQRFCGGWAETQNRSTQSGRRAFLVLVNFVNFLIEQILDRGQRFLQSWWRRVIIKTRVNLSAYIIEYRKHFSALMINYDQ